MRDWVASVESTHYCLGSVMGPHPYPWMVREFHRVIGDEARAQCDALIGERPRRRRRVRRRRLERNRHLLGLRRHERGARRRRAGRRRSRRSRRARRRARHEVVPHAGRVRPGARGRTRSPPASTIPGVGPEHSHLASIGRARYEPVTDAEVIDAFQLLSRTEGHHPRARVAPTRSPGCSRDGAEHAGRDGAREPVGPRRQGRRPDDGHPGCDRHVIRRPLEAALRAARDAGPQAARPVHHRWASATTGPTSVRAVRRRRCRRDRDRHPVLRSGDGRSRRSRRRRELALERGRHAGRRSSTRSRDLDVGFPSSVMTYYNIVFHAGHERFAQRLPRAGSGGCILPDLPLEESARGARPPTRRASRRSCSPRRPRPTSDCRAICARARGFVYAVGLARCHRRARDARGLDDDHGQAAEGRHRHAGARRRRHLERRSRRPRRAPRPTVS